MYKDNWQIEISFKMIKQKLKIESFVETKPNAVMTQIWTVLTALIAILILKYFKYRSTIGWLLSNLVALLNLWGWINNPYEMLPAVPDYEQLSFRGI